MVGPARVPLVMRYLTELGLSLPDADHLRGIRDVDRGRPLGQVIRLTVLILEVVNHTNTMKSWTYQSIV